MNKKRSRRKRWIFLSIGVALLAVVAIVTTQLRDSPAYGPPVIGATTVEMHDESFTPPVIQVAQGTLHYRMEGRVDVVAAPEASR